MTPLDFHPQMLLRLVIAVVLGALIGYERERKGKPAGVRTHGMVSVGAALFIVVSLHGFPGTGDPARVAAQIVAGIGFLGVGAILHQRGSVQGLTTAASLWGLPRLAWRSAPGWSLCPLRRPHWSSSSFAMVHGPG